MDFTTLTAVKAYGNVQSSTDDALLNDLITKVSAQIENHTNNALGQQSYTNQLLTAYIDADGILTALPHVPVIQSIASASWRFMTASPLTNYTSLDVANTEIEPNAHGCKVRFYSMNFARYRGQRIRLQMSYTGGFSGLNTGAYPVPADLELATRRLVWWCYKKREAPMDKTAIPEMGIVTVPTGWPDDVMKQLGNYRTVTPL